jgi:uncharacterized flavoprotein (TIGR03862 family)
LNSSTNNKISASPQAVIIGAGPAGLMAAEQIVRAGYRVDVFERMPSVGRKFLRAGVGGLNLTHAEHFDDFCRRYSKPDVTTDWLLEFDPRALREWAAGLGIETFVGSSGRVFPMQKKASTVLRAWLQRLRGAGVRIHTRHQWLGWEDDALRFATPVGDISVQAQVTILALGGGSWSRLGSDGKWVSALKIAGIETGEFTPSNCGFNYPWSEYIRERFAGAPLKSVVLRVSAGDETFERRGEAIISRNGVQGALIYHASRQILARIVSHGEALLEWDLLPDRSAQAVLTALQLPRGKSTLANHLRKRLGISGIKAALLHELSSGFDLSDSVRLAARLKCLPLRISSARPLDEAISTAGGIMLSAVDKNLMLRDLPGVFCAGEMLDWDAPTGGYLLNACLATGRVAGIGASAYLQRTTSIAPSIN